MATMFLTIPLPTLREQLLKKSRAERLSGDIAKATHTLSIRAHLTQLAQQQHEPVQCSVPQKPRKTQ